MSNFKDIILFVFIFAIIFLLVALVIFAIVMEIYVWITYGNTPISEVPTWAIFWLFGRR